MTSQEEGWLNPVGGGAEGSVARQHGWTCRSAPAGVFGVDFGLSFVVVMASGDWIRDR